MRLVGFGRCVVLKGMCDEEAVEAKSKDVIDLIAMVCSLQDLLCNTVFKNMITGLILSQNVLTITQIESQLEFIMNNYKLRVFPYGVWRIMKVLDRSKVGHIMPPKFDDDKIDEEFDDDNDYD